MVRTGRPTCTGRPHRESGNTPYRGCTIYGPYFPLGAPRTGVFIHRDEYHDGV